MNREIKFRAWSLDKNKIFDVGLIDFVEGVVYSKSYITWGNSTCETCVDGEEYDLYKIKLMQYTGLKDKNGKEIYEGDIVEVLATRYSYGTRSKFDGTVKIRCKIEMSSGLAWVLNSDIRFNEKFLVLKGKEKDQRSLSFRYELGDYTFFNDEFNRIHNSHATDYLIEVIGNIYENPDLLNEKKEL
jgi:uncharacterized phage protein (TIGR01671 family)